jgi:ABC-type spermidine/putrescine transport system permease subunit I
MIIDLVVRIFGWMLIFARTGAISSILQWIGVIKEPYSLLFTEQIIIIGIVQFCIPLMALVMIGVLSGLDESLVEAARNLGASRFGAFRRITLPLSFEGIIAGGSLVFALSMSSFVVPQLLGGARNQMLANTVFNVIQTSGNTTLAAALSIILIVATIGLLASVESGSRVGGA